MSKSPPPVLLCGQNRTKTVVALDVPVDVSDDWETGYGHRGARRIGFPLRVLRVSRPGADLSHRAGELTSDPQTQEFDRELTTLIIDGLIAEHRSDDGEFQDLLTLIQRQAVLISTEKR